MHLSSRSSLVFVVSLQPRLDKSLTANAVLLTKVEQGQALELLPSSADAIIHPCDDDADQEGQKETEWDPEPEELPHWPGVVPEFLSRSMFKDVTSGIGNSRLTIDGESRPRAEFFVDGDGWPKGVSICLERESHLGVVKGQSKWRLERRRVRFVVRCQGEIVIKRMRGSKSE